MITLKKYIFTNNIINKIMAIFCTLLWGTTAPAVKLMFDSLKIQNNDIPKQIYFAGICFTLSGIFTLIVPCIKRKKLLLINRSTITDTFLIAIMQTTLQYIFFYIGLANTSASKASIISSFCTFFIIILSHFIYKDEKLTLQKTIGCMLGITSMVILNLEYSQNISLDFKLLGEGFMLFSAIAIAVPTPICKRLSFKEDVTIFTGNSFLIGGVFLILIGLLYGGNINLFSTYNFCLLLYLSVSSSIAGVLWNYLLKYNEVSKISIYNLLVPIFGTLFSYIILKENIYEIKTIISLILASSGIYMVEKVSKTNKVNLKEILNKCAIKSNKNL